MRRYALVVAALLIPLVACRTASTNDSLSVAPVPDQQTAAAQDHGGRAESAFPAPERIGQFRLVDQHVYPEPRWGAQYRYRDGDALEIDLFVYPGPDFGTRCATACAKQELRTEVDGTMPAMEELVADGRLERVALVAQSSRSPSAGARWRIGHEMQLKFVRSGKPLRSDFVVHYFPGLRVKFRATYEEQGRRAETVQTFIARALERLGVEPPPRRALPEPIRAELFALLAGEWDWTSSNAICGSDRHRITVADDSASFVILGSDDEPTVYRVLGLGTGVLGNAPHAIRAAIDGETRKTESGAVVVWDLVFVSADRYAWHRSDWAASGRTYEIVRCRDGAAVEWP
jgi:hypothetical protein